MYLAELLETLYVCYHESTLYYRSRLGRTAVGRFMGFPSPIAVIFPRFLAGLPTGLLPNSTENLRLESTGLDYDNLVLDPGTQKRHRLRVATYRV